MAQLKQQHERAGITLVELLVVFAILGLLIGLLIPAVGSVRLALRKQTLRSEIIALSDAIEQYKLKYGEYPPDGSSWPIMEAHLRRVFPNIDISELQLLDPACYYNLWPYFQQQHYPADIRNDPDLTLRPFDASNQPSARFLNVMDRAEALVFFLGGFSEDRKKPFTGLGGPFSVFDGGNLTGVQINSARQNAIFSFDPSRLSLTTVDGYLISNDETMFGQIPCQSSDPPALAPVNDLLPVYLCASNSWDDGAPYAYFDSRTYMFQKDTLLYQNFYQRSEVTQASPYGAARPYLSDEINSRALANPPVLKWANHDSFQIVAPGFDGKYGSRVASLMSANPVLFSLPSGQHCTLGAYGWSANSGGTPFVLPEHTAVSSTFLPALDDATNAIDAQTVGDAKSH